MLIGVSTAYISLMRMYAHKVQKLHIYPCKTNLVLLIFFFEKLDLFKNKFCSWVFPHAPPKLGWHLANGK